MNSPELLAAAAAEGWQELLEKVQALVQQVWAQNQEITAYLAPRRAEVSAALQRLQQMRNFNRTYRTTKLAFGPGLAVDQRG
ncbi:hypothetical protein GCM10025857_26650 [Alicyclobacillus contaminans]|nr:hypothetical protein GCM10025857_26650 [Alicyclobacillus contaminans]